MLMSVVQAGAKWADSPMSLGRYSDPSPQPSPQGRGRRTIKNVIFLLLLTLPALFAALIKGGKFARHQVLAVNAQRHNVDA